MNAFDFFECVYCISADAERKKRVTREFEKVGILNRIEWIDGLILSPQIKLPNYHRNPSRQLGCSLSHLQAVVKSIGKKNMLVFEDDIVFNHVDITDAINELPNDWDGFFLGMIPQSPLVKYSNHLAKVKKIHVGWWGNFARALNGNVLQEFCIYWIKNAFTAQEPPFDCLLNSFLKNVYVCIPPACDIYPCQSLIDGGVVDSAKYWKKFGF